MQCLAFEHSKSLKVGFHTCFSTFAKALTRPDRTRLYQKCFGAIIPWKFSASTTVEGCKLVIGNKLLLLTRLSWVQLVCLCFKTLHQTNQCTC